MLCVVNKSLSSHSDYIFSAIDNAFNNIVLYVQRFEQLRCDYQSNLQMQPNIIIAENATDRLRQYCAQYSIQVDSLQSISANVHLGLFQLDQSIFSIEFKPMVERLLILLESSISKRSASMVVELEAKARTILTRLMKNPDKTIDCLAYIQYLDECTREIGQLDENIGYTSDLFTLMAEYHMNVQEEHEQSHKS